MFRKKINYKRRNLVFSGLAIVLLTISCQKDDICPESTPTTPLIKVLFLDNTNDVIASKPVIGLRVRAINVEGLNDTLIKRSTTSQIDIPLNTNADITEYEFTEYALAVNGQPDAENPSNTDIVSFTYARNEVYINRACGFKVEYEDLRAELGSIEEDVTNNWIKRISIKDSITENETTTYISIYH